jgi:hypothetical protein
VVEKPKLGLARSSSSEANMLWPHATIHGSVFMACVQGHAEVVVYRRAAMIVGGQRHGGAEPCVVVLVRAPASQQHM